MNEPLAVSIICTILYACGQSLLVMAVADWSLFRLVHVSVAEAATAATTVEEPHSTQRATKAMQDMEMREKPSMSRSMPTRRKRRRV
jgi:hypothetical protein